MKSDFGASIALVGTMPPPIGGTTVLFKSLCDYSESCSDVAVHDLRRIGVLGILKDVYGNKNYKLILWNLSSNRLPYIWLIGVLSRLYGKEFAVRGFGGSWDLEYEKAPALSRLMFRWVVRRAKFLCFETNSLVGYFRERFPSGSIEWLPNYRDLPVDGVFSVPCSGRLVYVGRVCSEKGVNLLIEAVKELNGRVSLDIFGPVDLGFEIDVSKWVAYKGVLDPSTVSQVIRQYDALVLPTYWVGEGYPGVVLEAFAAGVPVLSTRWRAVPELFVGRECMLAEPMSRSSLLSVLTLFVSGDIDRESIVRSQWLTVRQFEAGRWNEALLSLCREALRSDAV